MLVLYDLAFMIERNVRTQVVIHVTADGMSPSPRQNTIPLSKAQPMMRLNISS
jgi:hypothetical protein